MPAMPRPSKAKKISDKVMKNCGAEPNNKPRDPKIHGETKFEQDIRMLIKR